MADQDPRSTYIDYVQNVLGVKAIMRDAGDTPNLIQKPLVVRVQGLSSYTEAEKDLLSKMLAALKLDPSVYAVVETGGDEEKNFTSNLILDFVDERTEVSDRVLTYSPRTLIQKPDLKKIAWADLQKIIAVLKP
ncbi:MAG: hypothetical protein K2P92_08420 [Bdellovibrionaceae bacterium]|nr:hypothetical protein [Pseudobdellovibrionaceae bacterium]